MRFVVAVDVMPKGGIADPQGLTIERALPGLGLSGFSEVRVGKRIQFSLEVPDEAAAQRAVDVACRRFLANPVIEEFRVSIKTSEDSGARG